MQRNRDNENILEIMKELKTILIQWYDVGSLYNIFCSGGLFRHLKFLNISRNNISLIPRDFGTLPTLQKLDISNNDLGLYNDYSWSWLEQMAIKNNLLFLNLSKNLLTKLPIQITKLNKLLILIISHNKLTCLPQSIKNIKQLLFLDVSHNNLLYLPASIILLDIYHINLEKNSFSSQTSYVNNLKMPKLTELSAKVIVNQRLEYDATVLPRSLIKYIDEVNYCCICGSTCFDSHIREIVNFPLEMFQIVSNIMQMVKSECYYCSLYCFNYCHAKILILMQGRR